MAAYCAQADILEYLTDEQLAQLADLDDDGTADAAVVSRACADASRQIDGYISPRYTVPCTGTAPDLLKVLATRWAVYLLQLARQSVTEDARRQHEEDVKFLERVGEGKASLGDPVNAPEGDAAPGVNLSADDRQFTRTKMSGW